MLRTSSVASVALAAIMLTPIAAWAQGVTVQQGPADRAAEVKGSASPTTDVGEVVVTGSRVIRNGYQAPTPVTTVAAEQLVATAPTRLGDALTQLPQFRASPNPRSTYQASLSIGTATLSLRGLGSNRTLVLIDGRRYVPASQRGDYDIELIPSSLLQRVDIVTGGASAQYGSDAIGGVVNLVLDKRFKGLKLTAQGGISEYGDGASWRTEATAGADLFGGRGHLIASYSHVHFDEIDSQASRPWGRRYVGLLTLPGVTPTNQILDSVGQNASYGGAVVSGPLVSGQTGLQFLPGGQVAPYNVGNPRTAAATVNADGTHLIQGVSSGLTNDNGFAHFDYDLTPKVRLYADVILAKQRPSFNPGYPTYSFGSTPITIFSGNAFLPSSVQTQLTTANSASFQLQRVNRDFGYTYTEINRDVINLTGGIEADISGWTVGAYAVWGRNKSDNVVYNNVNVERLYAAADAVRDPASGQVVCRTTLTNPGVYPGCVPINLFGEGTPSQAAIDYVRLPMAWQTEIVQKLATLYVRGEPFKTWAGPVSLGFGGEVRSLSLEQVAPELSSHTNVATGIRGFPAGFLNRQGGFSTLNIAPASGDVNVREGYAEILVPLAKDLPFGKALDFNGAVRYTDYSLSGGVTSWKLGLTYQPISDVRFRATYSQDIRAPNLGELYVAGLASQNTIIDPQLNGRSYFIFSRGAPSPSLSPETGRTYSVGTVFKPSFLPGLSASVDYFNIGIDGIISTLDAQQTVNACARGSAFNCDLITRDTTSNEVLRIVLPAQNLSQLETDGVDLDVSYNTELAGGRVRFRGIGTWTPNYILTVPGAAPINYAGELGVGGQRDRAFPELSATLSVSYERGGFGATLQERLISSGVYDVTLMEGVNINDNSIPAIAYTDLSLQYRFRTLRGEPQLFMTINNLWGKDPPVFPVGSPIQYSETNRLLYDTIGRYVTFGVRASF